MKRLLLASALTVAAAPTVAVSPQSLPPKPAPPVYVTLKFERDRDRVLLVFGNGNNALAETQLTIAADHIGDFNERNLLLVGLQGTNPEVPTALLPPADDIAARKRFAIKPGQFTVILLGKDGGEKLRSHTPILWDKLQSTIDAMPMRQQEMQLGKRSLP